MVIISVIQTFFYRFFTLLFINTTDSENYNSKAIAPEY